ncbi:serine/threonine protein kinase [Chloroflexota bacterium]
MPSLIGQTLGHYRILEQLGQGGMATVYKAYDTRLERDVAIKIIRKGAFPPDILDHILKRFEREAKALARLSHPNILKVYEYGEFKGQPYLVMEYLPGGTLKQRMGKPIPWQEAFRIMKLIAGALAYAHEEGILHRDVKPTNILLAEKWQPMLTDFGIVRFMEEEETTALTATGMVMGTAEYMSPEQGMGKAVDELSDIYSLGVVLYEFLAGRKPFKGDSQIDVVFKHVNEPLPDPLQYAPDLPAEVVQLLQTAMAKKPDDRYSYMKAMIAAIEDDLMRIDKRHDLQYAPTGKPELLPKPDHTSSDILSPRKRSKKPWLIGLGGMLIVSLIFPVYSWISSIVEPTLPPTQSPTYTKFPSSTLTSTISSTPEPTPSATILPSITPTKSLQSTRTSTLPKHIYPPITPVLSRPQNGWHQALSKSGKNFSFRWYTTNAFEYQVELWGGSVGKIYPCGWTESNGCTIEIPGPGTYYWRVRARNSKGEVSQWTETWSFKLY